MLLDVLNGQKTTVSKIKQAKDAVQFGHVHFDVWFELYGNAHSIYQKKVTYVCMDIYHAYYIDTTRRK